MPSDTTAINAAGVALTGLIPTGLRGPGAGVGDLARRIEERLAGSEVRA